MGTWTSKKSRFSSDDPPASKKKKTRMSVLWTIYINIALYALCYQLQKPVEPFLIEFLIQQQENSHFRTHKRTEQQYPYDKHPDQEQRQKSGKAEINRAYGRLESFFSAVQTIGSPLIGILLDSYGARCTSVVVYLSSALSYGILAHATSMKTLFLSKLPTIFQHAFLVAQATAATVIVGDESLRAQALGRMTTAYTVGSTIGPAMGGMIASHGNYYSGAWWAIFGSLLSAWLSWTFLHPKLHEEDRIDLVSKRATVAANQDRSSTFRVGYSSYKSIVIGRVQTLSRITTKKNLWPLLVTKFASGVTSAIYQTALPLALTQNMKIDASMLGFIMSSSSAVVALFSGFALAPLTRALGSPFLMKTGMYGRLFFICLVATNLNPSNMTHSFHPMGSGGFVVVVACISYSVCTHMLATSITTQTTGMVIESEQGSLLGLEHGLFSIARIMGPPIGAFLFTVSLNSFWSIATVCILVEGTLLYYFFHRTK